MAKQPEQFNPADNIRKELDAKIENKVSNHVFYWAFGILFAVLLAILGSIFNYISKIDDKKNLMNERLVRVETQMKSIKFK